MHIFVSDIGRTIYARESGSNKQSASKLCALSLVRQLYHLGVIEAYSGTLKQRKDDPGLQPYPIDIAPDLLEEVDECIDKLKLVVSKFGNNINLNFSIPYPVSIFFINYIQ